MQTYKVFSAFFNNAVTVPGSEINAATSIIGGKHSRTVMEYTQAGLFVKTSNKEGSNSITVIIPTANIAVMILSPDQNLDTQKADNISRSVGRPPKRSEMSEAV